MKNYEFSLVTQDGLGTKLMFGADDIFHAVEQLKDYVVVVGTEQQTIIRMEVEEMCQNLTK